MSIFHTTESRYYQPQLDKAQNPTLFAMLIDEINKRLSSGIGYDQILDFVFDSLHILIPYDRIGIALLDKNGEEICIKWAKSLRPAKTLTPGYCARLNETSLSRILESGQPRIINDLAEYGKDHPQSESTRRALLDGIRSSLTCPLRGENKAIGIVFFSSYAPNKYQDQHVQTFLALANELSVIIELGRLRNHFEVTKDQTQELSMVLHDLRSPLAIIQGYLEETHDEPWYKDLDESGKEIFSVLYRNTKYMFDLLEDLSEVNQLHREGKTLQPSEVDLAKFCLEIEENGKALAKQKNMTFLKVISRDVPETAFFDPRKIRQALDNLISNAIKFSYENSIVSFIIDTQPGRLVFSVEDQGQGIPKEELTKLFREFGKTSVRPTSGEHSTGLGLAIANKIVEQHNGQMSVTSEIGKGSVFTFWIPVQSVHTDKLH